MSNLTLYGTISMSLMIGVLVALIVGALLDGGGRDGHPNDDVFRAALADQRRRRAVLGTPTDEHPYVSPMSLPARGARITYDVARPRRHVPEQHHPSLITATLDQASAWLAMDRVKRDAERLAFQQLMATFPRRAQGHTLLTGH